MRERLLRLLLFFPDAEPYATPADAGLPFEDLEIPTSDGERLHGWWVPAPVTPATGHVLFCHGNAGNLTRRLPDVRLLAARGFDTLIFDYRGYGRSTGRPSEAGTYRDARAALATLRARSGVTPSRVLYVGESLGAAIALELAIAVPPAGLVLRSPFTDVPALARLHYPQIPRFLVPDAYPSLRRVPELRCPLLVFHGDEDALIPLAHGEALFAAAPQPKRLHVLRGVGHNDILARRGAEQADVIAEWWRTIGGSAQQ